MSHAHTHLPSPGGEPSPAAGPASRVARRVTLALLIPVAALTVAAMILLWPQDPPRPGPADGPLRAAGQVLAVDSVPCPPTPDQEPGGPGAPTECGTVEVRLTDGPGAGQTVITEIPAGPGAITVRPGDDVVVLRLSDGVDGTETYAIQDHQRGTELWLVGAAFALAVILFGRWRGLTALLGLGLTFAVLLLFIVPAILDGRSPLLVAIVGAAAIMLTVLYLTHGFTLTTTIAVAGTLISLSITAALSAVATAVTHLSGVADETSSYLNITQGEVNMRGLLLAGIVIGSLGVLDDVTVTQSATVTELARANPGYHFRQLYQAATRVGRAHIASVINTIVLAYAGASLPLMLLFAVGSTGVSELLTTELIAQELVRAAVGTIGLIAAVPITTALAALLAAQRPTLLARQPADAPQPDAPRPDGLAATDAPRPAPGGTDAPRSAPGAPGAPSTTGRRSDVDPWMAFVERRR